MPLKNSENQFGAVTKTFHWVTALLVIGLLAAGLYMTGLPSGLDKFKIYNLHKSFGVTVLMIVFCRILWNNVSKRPVLHDKIQFWEKPLLSPLHLLFYFMLIVMPLSGWVFSAAANHPVSFFGLFTLPNPVAPDKELAKFFREVHEITGFLLMGAVGLHILVALKHHFIDKDIFLKRMLPMIVLCLLASPPAFAEKPWAEKPWNVILEKSSLTFRARQMGVEFKGSFGLFVSTIHFDPDKLAASKAVVVINTASVDTQNAERDETLRGKEWFDVTRFPEAKFETTSFRKTGDSTYEATGQLTLNGVTVPVVLPFRLAIVPGSDNSSVATVDGTVTLDRAAFNLGGKNWADVSVIANEVAVDVHLFALSGRSD